MNDTLARVPPHRLAGWARLVLLLLVLCAAWALLYGWSVRAEAQDAPHVLMRAREALQKGLRSMETGLSGLNEVDYWDGEE